MKLRKILSSIIATAMLLSSMGLTAYAEESVNVSTKTELDAAISTAEEGDTILLTADIDYDGTSTLTIDKSIILDLGNKTLTTHGTYGGLILKGNCSIKNGTLNHKGTVAAIKAWNVKMIEDIVIDVAFKEMGKTIGGIVVQNVSTNRIDTIKNVTIKGEGLTNGIETYNCGDAVENVIGSMENVTIDAVGKGMLISAPCGTATNCDIKGGTTGIEICIKGTYSATLDLVNCDVEGGEQAVYAHDEQKGYTYVGSLILTADENTTFSNENGVLLTQATEATTNVTLPDAITQVTTDITWGYSQDAGFYVLEDKTYGMIRFLFAADVSGEIEEYGIKYSKANEIAEDVTADGKTVSANGNEDAFYGDLFGISENSNTTYYAAAYVKVDGKYLWSEVTSCSPNWQNNFTGYQGGTN